MREVEHEVDESTAGSSQVGLGEEHADEEALHDGGEAEGQQEDEDDRRVAVLQDLPVLPSRDTDSSLRPTTAGRSISQPTKCT